MNTSKFLILAILGACVASPAQTPPAESQWVKMQRRDAKSGVMSAAYALTGQSEDSRHPSITLTCDGDRDPVVVYHTEVRLSAQAHDVHNYYASALWASVKVDNDKIYRALWDIIPGANNTWNEAVIDKKTLRSLLVGQSLRVSFRDSEDEEHIDEFQVSGLTLADLTGFCAPRWIEKNQLNQGSRSNHLSRNSQ